MGCTSSLPLDVSMSRNPGNHSSMRCSMLSTTEQRSLRGRQGGREAGRDGGRGNGERGRRERSRERGERKKEGGRSKRREKTVVGG